MSDARRDFYTNKRHCDMCKKITIGGTLNKCGKYESIKWDGLICHECYKRLEEEQLRGKNSRII